MIPLVLSIWLALIPGTAAAQDAFYRGEESFRAGEYATAEGFYREALARDPTHLRALLRLAMLVSWADHLPESISLYEKALEMDPGNREATLGLARVSAWASDYDRSIAIYQKLRSENPDDREATLGLAQVYAWTGDSAKAKELYLEVLSNDPNDVEARNGLAAALSWDGQLDDALTLYEETLQMAPSDKTALAGKARVLNWQGRTREARQAIDDALQKHPGEREAVKLDVAMRDAARPVFSASTGVAHDSDRNAFNTQHAGYDFQPLPGVTAGASYDRFSAWYPPTNEARVETMRGTGRTSFGRHLGVSGALGIDRIVRFDSSTVNHLTGFGAADYRLSDVVSFSGLFASETLLGTALSLDREVRMTSLTLGAAFNPIQPLSIRVALQEAWLTYDNGRDLLSIYGRYLLPVRRPKIGVSLNERYLSYDRDPRDGYFSPDFYLASVVGVDLSDRIGKRIGWSVEGTAGVQHVRGHGASVTDDDDVWGYRGVFAYDFDRGVTLEAYIGATNLALALGTGFSSTESGLRLRWRIGTGSPAESRSAQTGADAAAATAPESP